ncbi:hypothetical protein BOTCAL_0081g00100 [Botryotinia calthae]|uniref:Uncharacterized protein n=1 Tax=Botryotinia calthae TaxID=38488 RepID=A0A4Y8DA97_9HELO|nr:hypothetical protein BOTCAL_0081g00100 [Botryotinia calthae]
MILKNLAMLFCVSAHLKEAIDKDDMPPRRDEKKSLSFRKSVITSIIRGNAQSEAADLKEIQKKRLQAKLYGSKSDIS